MYSFAFCNALLLKVYSLALSLTVCHVAPHDLGMPCDLTPLTLGLVTRTLQSGKSG